MPDAAPDIKQSIAEEALHIVTGARRSAYGTPEQNFARIARLWNAHLVNRFADGFGGDTAIAVPRLEAGDVAAMMRLMKEARLAETPDHRDSYVDLVGYSLCGAEVAGVAMPDADKAQPKAIDLAGLDERALDVLRKSLPWAAELSAAPTETEPPKTA